MTAESAANPTPTDRTTRSRPLHTPPKSAGVLCQRFILYRYGFPAMYRRSFLASACALSSTGCLSVLGEHHEDLDYGAWYERPDEVALAIDPPTSRSSIDFGRQTFTPDEGRFYLVVPVTVENRTDDTITPPGENDYYAGDEHSPVFSRGTNAIRNAYRTTPIEPGESRSGNVVFEVEAGANAATVPVHYEHTMWRWSATWSAD